MEKEKTAAKVRELQHPCKSPANKESHKPSSKQEYMSGKMIEPLELKGNEQVKDFIDNVFGNSGYNARRLAEACDCAKRMLSEKDTVVGLTLAGAMTPIGMSGPIIKMIELGFIDFIISTGANIYHDLHRAFDYPMVQGEVEVDDEDLNKHGVARIYDVFIEDDETLMATDESILGVAEGNDFKRPLSTAEFHKMLGDKVLKKATHPEKSFIAQAAKFNVPIYTSSPGDSSIGMNLACPWLFGHKVMIDTIKDVVETTAIIRSAKKNGVIMVGGGSPKNFYLQTQPTLLQIFLDESKGGHDYFIQLTTDSPQWGGLSGATPQEAKSWGKVKQAGKNTIVVYSCASITFPLVCQYAVTRVKPRQRKELLKKIDGFVEELRQSVYNNKEFKRRIKKETPLDQYKRVYEKVYGPYDSDKKGSKNTSS